MHRHDVKLDGHGLVQRVVSPSRVSIMCGREEYAYRTCDASDAEAELLLQVPDFLKARARPELPLISPSGLVV